MPPANIVWTEPLVQDADLYTSNSIVVRRITPKPKTEPCSTTNCDSGYHESLPVEVSPGRQGNHQRRRKRSKSSRLLFPSRAINAVFWLVLLVGMLYYRKMVHTVNIPRGQVKHGPSLQLGALMSSSKISSSTSQQQDHVSRKLQPESIIFDEHIVHIIHTRFMQHQPDLIDLGLARLELFKEFTLKSMQLQSSRNFLWVIRTDPDLDDSLRTPLLDALSSVDNHLLIASNENPNIQIHEITSVDPSMVWSGDLDRARTYLQAQTSTPKKILESRLDADDALNVDFVQHLQEVAVVELPEEASQWKIWCASHHIEWQYHSVTDTIDSNAGVLLSIKNGACVSVGLTIGYTEGVRVHDLPPIKHQNLAKVLPSCKRHHSKCLAYIRLIPTALRARTPTSAGMLNVLLGHKVKMDRKYVAGAKKQEIIQQQLWEATTPRFGLAPEQGSHLRSYLKEHLQSIAVDNLRGQCSSGHSCKESSKILLQAIVDNPAAFD